jgi:hypothetical protein
MNRSRGSRSAPAGASNASAGRFTPEDLQQIQAHGLSLSQVEDQLRLLARPPRPLQLERPCTVGDGIRRLASSEEPALLELQAEAARQGRFIKFVPASGAATRMFDTLLYYYHQPEPHLHRALSPDRMRGERRAREFLAFFDALPRMPFYHDLKACLAARGEHLEALLTQKRYREILDGLFGEGGLGLQTLPKALIPFHHYDHGRRTPLEEHLVEAQAYVRDREGACRLHFTILPAHRQKFERCLAKVRPRLEARYGCRLMVDFSYQDPGTDTLAVDEDNRPCRDAAGRLVFRPGGHGALLKNLDRLQGDLAYIKNIDNVVPDRLKEPTYHWKRLLGGVLVALEQRLNGLRRGLTHDPHKGLIRDALDFIKENFALPLPAHLGDLPPETAAGILSRLLDRPLRVCGVVPNEGEPGGAPFWVREADGTLSLQIVEGAQVDMSAAGQRAVWEAATHFNPVDLVCALRNEEGVPFALSRYTDPEAVFISTKSKDGCNLKALELPGLWNGAMARWLTVFVEVPKITFNPVKTVFDLLRPEHQPEQGGS